MYQILLGEAGVGKSSIVYKLASSIVTGDCPETFKNAVVISLDVNAIIYNRLAWKPELTVSYNNEVLTTESGAIAITYTNNINAGTATATVNFINYKNGDNSDFKKDVQFTIKKKSLGTDGVAAPGITTAFTSSSSASFSRSLFIMLPTI